MLVKDIETVELIEGEELTDDERKWFDYIKWEDYGDGEQRGLFFRYKGKVYDYFGQLEHNNPENGVPDTDGIRWTWIIDDTYFTGLVIHDGLDSAEIKVGRWYSS
ncbi:hypothetical protein AB0K16_22210 [Nonomuraea jabiensis]|uniref:hypothetical protein n=1 Tax=Nonomuraea jabiensis TaxID=882448 RepID=UPI003437A67C